MADAAMRYLGRINQQRGGNLPVAIVHRRRLLLHSGRAFMLLGALVLTRRLNTTSAAATGLLVAFLLWLLGVALAMLAVARRTALPGARVRQRHRRVDGFYSLTAKLLDGPHSLMPAYDR